VLAAPQDPAPQTIAYVSESRDAGFLVIGLLITNRPLDHLRDIRSVKRRTNYRRTLSHHSTDRFKIPCVRELGYFFCRAPDLRFMARVIERSDESEVGEASFRVRQYTELLRDAELAGPVVLRMRRTKAGWPGQEKVLANEQAERLKAMLATGMLRRAELVSRRENDGLVELSALLTGALLSGVRSIVRPAAGKAKTVTGDRIRALLEIPTLDSTVRGKWEPKRVSERRADRIESPK
jgi:hypothetical protein